ncbi:MAG TPA: cytochrome C oxidase subunit IV family protein [Alloacidobacterium sp.]|nr:cytochrome C oxidase subunit IV family protein [Alloacidobacterium sp.]
MSEPTHNEQLNLEPTHHEHHVVGPKTYGIIFGTLLFFTGLTVAASYLELYTFNAVVAIAIACIKAVLVILFFMHIKYSSRLTKLTVAAGFFTFLALITMTLTDYISRAWGLW